MERKFDVNYEKNLNNTNSFLEQLLSITDSDENKVALELQNLELLLEHVDVGLNRLYKLRTEHRDEIYNYLVEEILSTKEQLKQSNLLNIEERVRLLDLFSDMVQDIFKKKIKKTVPLSVKQKILFLDYLGILKLINDLGLNQNKTAELISLLIDGDLTNTTRAIRYNTNKVFTDNSKGTKSVDNLNRIRIEFEALGLSEIVNKIDSDIEETK